MGTPYTAYCEISPQECEFEDVIIGEGQDADYNVACAEALLDAETTAGQLGCESECLDCEYDNGSGAESCPNCEEAKAVPTPLKPIARKTILAEDHFCVIKCTTSSGSFILGGGGSSPSGALLNATAKATRYAEIHGLRIQSTTVLLCGP